MKNKMIGNVTYAIIDDVQDIFKLFIYKRVKLSCYTPCRRLGGGVSPKLWAFVHN